MKQILNNQLGFPHNYIRENETNHLGGTWFTGDCSRRNPKIAGNNGGFFFFLFRLCNYPMGDSSPSKSIKSLGLVLDCRSKRLFCLLLHCSSSFDCLAGVSIREILSMRTGGT
ncbi:hypothetical protein CDAR_494561 [Caerostris darwini]|uniref:Uncharacterized protein n=1 Tax=Caerostris darwini TaxID=1538125 RepID=A0AAV4RPP7_9ARAC|nr:hypothetical protein CDAR_494561 [Caerostris darwini]